MTLAIVVKCNDGIIIGTDSRTTEFSKNEVSGSYETKFKDDAVKVCEFHAPHNYVTVFAYNAYSLSAGSDLDPEMDPCSIFSCLRRFEKEVLLKKYPHKRISVPEFRTELENFLIPYWERFRSQRDQNFQEFEKAKADLPPEVGATESVY